MLLFCAKLIIFLLLCPTILFFIGRVLIGKHSVKLQGLELFYFSLVLGIFFIILQAVIFGLLKIRFLSLSLIIVTFLYSVLRYRRDFSDGLRQIIKDKLLLILLLVGVVVMGIVNFPSGWQYADGIDFWSSQGHDGLWHVSLMEEIKTTFPPTNPLYAGHQLTNYHYTSDIFMGEFYRLFPFFGSLDLYFRFYPIILSLLIGLSVFVFVSRHWQKEAAYYALAFTYFCGSFGYIVSLINHGSLFSGETTFWASQGNTILGNPPHTFGIIFLTTILALLSVWEKTKDKIWLHYIFLIGFALATVKVSSGAILCASLLGAGFIYLLQTKKPLLFLLGIAISISNFAALKIISPTAQSFILFEPLWFPRTMMVTRLNWMDWELRRQHYMWVNTWRSWLREISLELIAIFLFIIGNTGARILGLAEVFSRLKKKISPVDVFMYTGSLASIVVVLLFVQSGVTFNLIQFIQIYLHFMGILAGVTLWKIISKLKSSFIKVVVISAVAIFCLPTVIGSVIEFSPWKNPPLARVSNSELSALTWLKNNTPIDSIIFTKPFDQNAKYRFHTQPMLINAWYPTMYVHSFSERRTFLSGEEQLTITGYKIDKDRDEAKFFMTQHDNNFELNFLKKNHINYLYFRLDELDTPIKIKDNNLTEVYKNDEVVIYKNEQN